MTRLELPTLRTSSAVAVTIERADLAGSAVFVVTVREHAALPPKRRWYGDVRAALAHAGEQADRHSLPLLDLRNDEPE